MGNERGIYLGTEIQAGRKWLLTGYVDICYFPWLKYQVTNASYSGEWMAQAIYKWSKTFTASLRYRGKLKERDYTDSTGDKYLASHLFHRWRYQQDYLSNKQLCWRTTFDFNLLHFMDKSGTGYMLTQAVNYSTAHDTFLLNASVCYFHTDSYDNRISIYERGLPYTFSYPSFYDEGIHESATIKWVINRHWIVMLKASGTYYFNKPSIGTGTELIAAKHREDVSFQVCCKL